jgi:hypothetical protein
MMLYLVKIGCLREMLLNIKLLVIYKLVWRVNSISSTNNEIIINIDSKKLLSAGIVLGIIVIVFFSYIQALFAFDAPSKSLPLDVTQVSTLDSNNVSQSTFNAGDLVRINSTVEKALRYMNFPFSYDYFDFFSDTDVRVIVMVMDNSDKPVFIQSSMETVSPGNLVATTFDYTISLSATSGTYNFEVMVWSDWLPGGKALSDSSWGGTFTVS